MVAWLQWWRGGTIGTTLLTRRKGHKVGEDAQGNRYYQTKDGKRRWVIYKGENEATRVPPDWHRWLHHTAAEPPSQAPLPHKPWEKEHIPNLTGTAQAYYPAGSLHARGQHAPATGDYEAWQPEE
ncbi:MAG: NADH:ubiquinone oxidoreductase subunit NDUFA12 [Rhodothalassiaceae bacterium]